MKGTLRETLEVNLEKLSLGNSDVDKHENVSESVFDTDTNDDSEEGLQPVEQIDEASEFGNTEFKELVLQEGPE